MGYELVKLDPQDEPYKVADWEDPNYFRLNTVSIGRASYLALWSTGLISGEEMIQYTNEASIAKDTYTSAEDLLAVHGVKTKLQVDWLEPFTNNDKKTVRRNLCLMFANALSDALTMIKDSPIQPDYELKDMEDFVEFLRSCPNGVWLE